MWLFGLVDKTAQGNLISIEFVQRMIWTRKQCKNGWIILPQISRYKQCKNKDATEGQLINELLESFQRITELKTLKISKSWRKDYEN